MADGLDAVPLSTSIETVETAIHSLLAKRAAGATICPSEAARIIAGTEGEWRDAMGKVHGAVDRLHRNGTLMLSWKGKTLAARTGPYRIGWPA